MDLRFKPLYVFLLGLASQSIFAGSMGPVENALKRFYIGGEGGASISLNNSFGPRSEIGNNRYFFVTPTNQDWVTNFGIGGLGGVFLGYQYNQNLAFQFTYDYRGGYSYNIANGYWEQSDPNLTPTDQYRNERYSAQGISFQSFIFDMILNPKVDWGGFVPYVKAGIGFSINQIGTVRDYNLGKALTPFDLRLGGSSTTSFAWDAGVGANYFFNEMFSVGLGYRFIDVGRLTTSNVFHDLRDNNFTSTITPLQASNVFLNEVVGSITYHFDYI